jgi:hypothetical protein
MDYNNAHHLHGQLQRAIFELAGRDLSPERLLNRVYFLDDMHQLLPIHASNSFFAIERASNFLSIQQQSALFSQRIHKVMVCTSAWLEEFYFRPFRELQEAATAPNSTLSSPLLATFHCSHCRGTTDVCTCECGCSLVAGASQCHVVHKGTSCIACGEENNIRGHRFRCRTCEDVNLCEGCYDSGAHDHTHAFDKFERLGMAAIQVPPRVQSLTAASLMEAVDQEVPTAEAVPINECKACEEGEATATNNFWPGQTVILVGLSTAHMNGKEALVVSVTDARILVRLLQTDYAETYYVRPENLALAQPAPGQRGSGRPLELI